MTREEHLAFCRKCTNRKMDIEQGLVCSITGGIATFDRTCADFNLDPAVTIVVDDEERLDMAEVKAQLPAEIYEQMKLQENLVAAIFSGLIAGVLGAVLWGVITVTMEVQFGLMPILIGTAVGFVIRKTGNGVSTIFGILGAGISLFGCLLGNLFSIVGFISLATDLEFFTILMRLDLGLVREIMSETFEFVDLIFYMVALTTGYKLSFRAITEKDIQVMKATKRL